MTTADCVKGAQVGEGGLSHDRNEPLPGDMKDDDEDEYTSGIKMRDLTDSEVHQFPGLKREHWW
jgi:hypothetical protein